MRRAGYAGLLLAVLAVAARPSSAASYSLLYSTAAEWKRSDRATKIALAGDFMRIYCGDIRMSLDRLVDCLDGSAEAGPTFPQAMACSSRLLQEIQSPPPPPH
jgi:hypothetical protein